MKFSLSFGLLLSLIFVAMTSAAQSTPSTLDEAFASLDGSLKPDEKLAFMERSEREAVIEAHFAVGLYIRNQWLRPGKSELTKLLVGVGAHSYDDMSAMILTSYWRHLHGKPIRLKEQGACYDRWYSEQLRLIEQAKAKGEDSYSTPDFNCPP